MIRRFVTVFITRNGVWKWSFISDIPVSRTASHSWLVSMLSPVGDTELKIDVLADSPLFVVVSTHFRRTRGSAYIFRIGFHSD